MILSGRLTRPFAAIVLFTVVAAIGIAGREASAAALTMGGAQQGARESRAEAIARGFGGASPQRAFSGRWLAGGVMLVTGTTVLWVIGSGGVRWWRAWLQSERAVFADLRRRLGLTRSQARLIRSMAWRAQARYPATLLLCPSLLRRMRQQSSRSEARQIDLILARLGQMA